MTRPTWRLFYGDGSTYSDVDGPPEAAPAFNVQCVAQWERGQRTIQRGGLPDPRDHPACDVGYKGYYCYGLEGTELWTLTDYVGFIDFLALPGWKTVKFGRSIDGMQFQDILRAAATDPDFL